MNSIARRSCWLTSSFAIAAVVLGVACERSQPGMASSEQMADSKAASAPEAEEAPAGTMGPAAKMKRVGRGYAGKGAPGAAAPMDMDEDDAVAGIAVGPIDPNGRFATTYRPGAGHLAAFEAAVARGIIPTDEREIVGDVGARYAPTFTVPAGKALHLQADYERGELPPSGGKVHVRVSLRSTDQVATERPQLAVHLVLDVSGSMRGAPIQQARSAAKAMVDRLAPTDLFSLTTFSTDANVAVKQGLVGPRKQKIQSTIDGIDVGGGTNIGAGLGLSYKEAAAPNIPKDVVNVVFLLSDGRANSGITNRSALSKLALDAFQEGVQTSSFGLGADYDGELMSSIADDGAGGYYYLRDPEQIAPALATELDKRLDPVATAVELRVRLKPGVDLMRVYGSRRLSAEEASRVRAIEVAADQQAEVRDGIKSDRKDDNKGGMRFFIPAFTRADSHSILLELRVAAGVGAKAIAQVELKYKDRVTKKNVVDEFPLKTKYANSDAASAKSVDQSVLRTVQGFAAGETLAQAAGLIARGNRARAVSLLSEREGILREAAKTLEEPLFLRDADRLARLRSHAGGNATGMGDPLVLAMLMETAGRVHMH